MILEKSIITGATAVLAVSQKNPKIFGRDFFSHIAGGPKNQL